MLTHYTCIRLYSVTLFFICIVYTVVYRMEGNGGIRKIASLQCFLLRQSGGASAVVRSFCQKKNCTKRARGAEGESSSSSSQGQPACKAPLGRCAGAPFQVPGPGNRSIVPLWRRIDCPASVTTAQTIAILKNLKSIICFYKLALSAQ